MPSETEEGGIQLSDHRRTWGPQQPRSLPSFASLGGQENIRPWRPPASSSHCCNASNSPCPSQFQRSCRQGRAARTAPVCTRRPTWQKSATGFQSVESSAEPRVHQAADAAEDNAVAEVGLFASQRRDQANTQPRRRNGLKSSSNTVFALPGRVSSSWVRRKEMSGREPGPQAFSGTGRSSSPVVVRRPAHAACFVILRAASPQNSASAPRGRLSHLILKQSEV
jgi:hypothetical protein